MSKVFRILTVLILCGAPARVAGQQPVNPLPAAPATRPNQRALTFAEFSPQASALTLPPGAPAASQTPSPLDQLSEKLATLRAERAKLERAEREVVLLIQEELRRQQEELRAQIERIGRMGVQLQPPPPLAPIAPSSPPVEPEARKPAPSERPAPKPVRPPTLTEELAVAYEADVSSGRATVQDLRALARICANAGEALDKARPPTVGHLRQGLDLASRRLNSNIPMLLAACRQHLALRFPPDASQMTPETAVACKLTLTELAAALEKVVP